MVVSAPGFRFLSLIVLALLFTTSGLSRAADPPNGFREFCWGDPPTNALKKKSGRADSVEIYFRRSKRYRRFLGLPVIEEAYLFAQGRFYSGTARIAGQASFGKIATALRSAFGRPSYPPERQDVLKWTWPGSPVEVELSFDPKTDRNTVNLLNSGF